MRRPHLGLAALVVVMVPAVTAAAGPAERQDRALPEAIQQVLALDQGGALVVGVSSDRLRRITPAGATVLVDHPAIGAIHHVAARGADLWVLGQTGLLHRTGDGPWMPRTLPAGVVDVIRPGLVVPLGPGEALVVRTLTPSKGVPGSQALLVRAGTEPPQTFWFPDVTFASAAGDPGGTVWALWKTIGCCRPFNDRPRGNARFAGGNWTLWRLANDDLPLPGVAIEPRVTRVWLASLVSDGRGGAYGIEGNEYAAGRVFHIDPQGALRVVDAALPSGNFGSRSLALDASGALLVCDVPYRRDDPVRIIPVDRGGQVEVVPLPAWYADVAERERPELTPASLSAAPGALWLATRPMVLSNAGGTWIVYVSPAVREDLRDRRRRARREAWAAPLRRKTGAILGFSAGFGAGFFGASAIHDERAGVIAVETLAGSAFGLLSWHLAEKANEDLARGAYSDGFLAALGASTAPLLAGFATWGTGELLDGSQNRGWGLVGALGGATAGAILGRLLTGRLRDSSPAFVRVADGFYVGITGAGATIGYQLLGGGPPR